MTTRRKKDASPPDWYPVESIAANQLEVRPRLFQGREGTGGKHYDEAAVLKLADTFDRKAFTPVVVVADRKRPGQFIIIEGHHRLALMNEMRRRDPKGGYENIPAVILEGNPYTPAGRTKLRQTALESNYRVKSTNFREDAKAAHALRYEGMGMTVPQVAERLRKKESEIHGLIAAAELPPTILERAVIQPELQPAAIALGRGKTRYKMSDEAVDAMFKSLVAEYERTGNPPGEQLISGRLRQLRERIAEGEQKNLGGLAGFDADVDLAAWVEDSRQAEEARQQRLTLGRQLTACERLADELGVDVSAVKELAQTRMDELDAEQEARVRDALQGHREAVAAAPETPPAAFQTPPPVPSEIEPVRAADAEMEFVQSGPDLFGRLGTGQTTMGDDFATNAPVPMAVGDLSGGNAVPLVDPAEVKAKMERQEQLNAGQTEMGFATVDKIASFEVASQEHSQVSPPTPSKARGSTRKKPSTAKAPKATKASKPKTRKAAAGHPFLSKKECAPQPRRRGSRK